MSEIKLRDKDTYPSDEVLQEVLGTSFTAFKKMEEVRAGEAVEPQWRYYTDGHAWLCKMLAKKKNLGWIHIYDHYFMVTFYFMERHFGQIEQLSIAQKLKENFFGQKPTGKLIPMFVTVNTGNLPEDVLTLLRFKKSLK